MCQCPCPCLCQKRPTIQVKETCLEKKIEERLNGW